MKPRFFLPALLLLATPLRADIILVQKVENKASGMDMNMEVTMKQKGDKMRIDAGPQSSSIVDLKSGDIITMMPAQKAYLKIPGAQLKNMAQQMIPGQPSNDGNPVTPPVPKPTGKKERISGYDTEEYVLETAGNQVSMWLAKDFPNAKLLMAAMGKMKEGPLGQMGANLSPAPDAMPGFPIRTVVKMGDMGTVTSTVISAREENLPATEFDIPADFKPITMPDFGGLKLPAPPAPGQ